MIGRYILQPEVMAILGAHRKRGAGGEIQLTDAMAAADRGAAVPRASTFDRPSATIAATRPGHIIANIALALQRDDVGPAVRAFIKELALTH